MMRDRGDKLANLALVIAAVLFVVGALLIAIAKFMAIAKLM